LLLRFLVRHGFVRVVGGRLVPILMVWDLAVIANRVRQIPAVDRGLRRGAAAASRKAASAVSGAPRPRRRDRPRR
jgi:hypothetical protein